MAVPKVVKDLGREENGQLSGSSSPEILDEVNVAHGRVRRSTTCKMFGKRIDRQNMLNAWIYGLARLPATEQLKLTEVLIDELVKWKLGMRLAGPDTLRAMLVEALSKTVDNEKNSTAPQTASEQPAKPLKGIEGLDKERPRDKAKRKHVAPSGLA